MAKNKKRQFNEAENYYFCTHVDSEGYVYQLLLTKREFDLAVERADKNPEDVYNDYIVLQGYKNCKNPHKPDGK
jgi:hypothetical protein